jgi:hypothetical protein
MLADWISLLGTLVALVTAVTAMLGLLKGRENGGKIDNVATMTDGRLTSVIERVEQLANVLRKHNIDIPDDPAVQPTPPAGPGR